jgi:DNA-binding MarR family transcriptional regulator
LKASGDLPVELWQNISAIYRTGIKRLNSRLSGDRITFSQWSILRALGKFGSMPMTRLSEYMLVAPANITGLVDKLERRKDSQDRRLFMIELTKKGQETQEVITQQFHTYVRHVFGSLSGNDRAMLLGLLRRLRSSMERIERLE